MRRTGVSYRDCTPFGYFVRLYSLQNISKGLAKCSQHFSPPSMKPQHKKLKRYYMCLNVDPSKSRGVGWSGKDLNPTTYSQTLGIKRIHHAYASPRESRTRCNLILTPPHSNTRIVCAFN